MQAHREVNRTRIFDAFAELVEERGYDAVSLADIAARAGLVRTAIYNYVPDKETLLLEYTARETTGYLERLSGALDSVDAPLDRLRAYIRTQLAYFADHHMPAAGPGLQLLVSIEGQQRIREHVSMLESVLRQILIDARQAGDLPDVDVDAALPLIAACLTRSSATQRAPGAPSLDEVIEHTTTFVLRAVGA